MLNLTWLVRNRAGAWHVVTGSWNNPAAPLEEAALRRADGARLVQLIALDSPLTLFLPSALLVVAER